MPREAIICRQLQFKDNRKKLAERDIGKRTAGKPYYLHSIPPGLKFGWRYNSSAAGSWVYKHRKEVGGKIVEEVRTIGIADDHEPADGKRILDFHQAVARATLMVHGPATADIKTTTLGQVLTDYETQLEEEGADPYTAKHPRSHLTPDLLNMPCALITEAMLKTWRRDTLKLNKPDGMKGSTYNRMRVGLVRAVKLFAKESLPTFLAGLPRADSGDARNVFLDPPKVLEFIAKSYAEGTHLGYMMDVLGRTGNRPAQVARLLIEDFDDADPKHPRLHMYRSKKGGGNAVKRQKKAKERFWLPIPAALAVRLREAAKGRHEHDRLLVQADGKPWDAGGNSPQHWYRHMVRRVAKAIGEDPKRVTAYALRHSSIKRMMQQREPFIIPLATIADHHDTSEKVIESNYSKWLINDMQDVMRQCMLEGPSMIGHNGGPPLIGEAA